MSGDQGPATSDGSGGATAGESYAQRLHELQSVWWKRALDVQRPYRWNLQRLALGRCLDVGCGIGRNLEGLGPGSVGIDHNARSIDLCRSRGLRAYTTHEFAGQFPDGAFDSMLLAHVLEHVDESTGDDILRSNLRYLRRGAKVVVITPQEWGYRTDPTHVRWVSHDEVLAHAQRIGLGITNRYSFPFPRWAGRAFKYNEFVTVLEVPLE